MRRTAGLLIAIALALSCVVSACGAPDRKAAADRLKLAIKEMPGVQDADVSYTNNFEQGAVVRIVVFLPNADTKQIEDVVGRINAVRGGSLNAFDQKAEFAVTPSRTVRVGRGADLDPRSIAADAENLRRLSGAVDTAEMGIFRNNSTADLKLTQVTTPSDDVFSAIREGFGDDAHVSVDLQPASNIAGPSWQVAFPFTTADQQRVDQQMAAMPVTIWAITVGSHGAIASLSVGLHNRDTAYQDLVSVIGITGAGPAHALNLSWRWEGDSAGKLPNFSGSVQVGACGYLPNAASELHPETYLTADARELQQRLRKQFDTCPK
ncbi:MAG: hypothetical protein WB785_03065 [Mycobacterium sp.]|uniref:hypothetical protein n=1 Tax=Mycobacterium sp. TaxID=1785 RepID=UPI003C4DA2D0